MDRPTAGRTPSAPAPSHPGARNYRARRGGSNTLRPDPLESSESTRLEFASRHARMAEDRADRRRQYRVVNGTGGGRKQNARGTSRPLGRSHGSAARLDIGSGGE